MANFNSGFIFNAYPGDNGFFWNGSEYMFLIRIHEVLKNNDNNTELMAKYILTDKIDTMYDSIVQTALYHSADNLEIIDNATVIIVFKIMDNLGIKDDFSKLIVNAYLHDDIKIIEDVKMLGALISTDESINAEDITTLNALFEAFDKFGMDDLKALLTIMFFLHENIDMSDIEPPPQLGETDWLIGLAGNLDAAYDYLLPFGLKVDWGSSSIQVMPEAENITVESPGIDGSMVVDTVYKDRLFQIVGFSEQGLTVSEKEELKRKISNILATSKQESKRLLVQSRGTQFQVRYTGQAEITEAPTWIKAKIPLLASVYGYNLFPHDVVGSGLIYNLGAVHVGPTHEISGPTSSFSFTFGAHTYKYSNSIPANSKLIIDHEMKSVWIVDVNGTKSNAMKHFSGAFQKVPPQKSVVITVPDNIKDKFHTLWKDPVIW